MAVVRLYEHVVVLFNRTRIHPPPPGHAEVKDERVAAIGVDEAVFRSPPEPDDPGSRKPLAKVLRHRPPEVCASELNLRDPTPIQHARKPANGGLDFGKLWHSADMADQPQAR